MKKMIFVLMVLIFSFLFIADNVIAQDRVAQIKAEIERHRRAIHDLKNELRSIIGESGEYVEEGGYGESGEYVEEGGYVAEGTPSPPLPEGAEGPLPKKLGPLDPGRHPGKEPLSGSVPHPGIKHRSGKEDRPGVGPHPGKAVGPRKGPGAGPAHGPALPAKDTKEGTKRPVASPKGPAGRGATREGGGRPR